jgi:hypothetical protein
MIEQKYKLPNGNTLIWLGNQPIHGCQNVLILAGGDVQFLKAAEVLKAADVQQEIEHLDRREFFEKYGWPNNSSGNDLYGELKGW